MEKIAMALAVTITMGQGALIYGPLTIQEDGKVILDVPEKGKITGPSIQSTGDGVILFNDDEDTRPRLRTVPGN